MMNQTFTVAMSRGGGSSPLITYNIFFFKNNPLSIWQCSDFGDDPIEFVAGVGWNHASDPADYHSDIVNSTGSLTCLEHELPEYVKTILEG